MKSAHHPSQNLPFDYEKMSPLSQIQRDDRCLSPMKVLRLLNVFELRRTTDAIQRRIDGFRNPL